MADLGAIGNKYTPYSNINQQAPNTVSAAIRGFRLFTMDSLQAECERVSNTGYGSISGTVREGGTPISVTVRCYRRDTGKMVGTTVSSSTSGGYQFIGLPVVTKGYVLEALDDGGIVGAGRYGAQSIPLITPG